MSPVTDEQKREAKARYLELKKYQWECGLPVCDGRPHEWMPFAHARSAQVVGLDDITAFITGRGYGKTRSGAEWGKRRMLAVPKHRLLIMAPTFGVGRDVCVEGESGLLACLPEDRVETWNRSMGELILTNGSIAKIFGANSLVDANASRGYQSSSIWCEEMASWRYQQEAWDAARYGQRLPDPQTVVTTTPAPSPVVERFLADEQPRGYQARVVTGSTYDNKGNLSEAYIRNVIEPNEGTRKGEQEIFGRLLKNVIGALWTRDLILHIPYVPEDQPVLRIVVAIDPAGSHKLTSDRTGIVVVAMTATAIFVLEDLSGHYTPNEWAGHAVAAYERWEADCVVAETNFGAEMVAEVLRGVSTRIRFKEVHASRGKQQRAEPVVGLYEQKRVYHVGAFPELETEMCTWVPPGQKDADNQPVIPSRESPDRMDALVWAIHELALKPHQLRQTMRA